MRPPYRAVFDHQIRSLSISIHTILIITALTGCGGGGGSNVRDSTPSNTVVYTPSVIDVPGIGSSTDVKNQKFYNHLKYTHADDAIDQGLDGSGVTIGIVDTGVNVFHPALQGQIKGLADFTSNTPANHLTDSAGHGTAVSQIIAGNKLKYYQGGIAAGSDLYVASSDNFTSTEAANASHWLASVGATIINNSWNLDGTNQTPSSFSSINTYLSFASSYIKNGGLIVFANGNEGTTQPGLYSLAPLSNSSLKNGWLAVSAYDPSTESIASYSNYCGAAAEWCLVAPGTVVTLDSSIDARTEKTSQYNYYEWTGTSFAAPQVTAAAALVWQKYPWMTSSQVQHAILGTADDLGDEGIDNIYGYGLLNTGAAVNGLEWLHWGNETLDVTSGEYTFSNDMFGSGGIIKTGVGTLVLSGNNTYSGPTTVSNGTLRVTQSLNSTVDIQEAGSLDLLNATINGSISNQGSLRATSATINGNVSQTDTGQFYAVLGSPTIVNGTFSANGTLIVEDPVTTSFVLSGQDNILTAHSITGSFSNTSLNSSLLLQSTLNISSTSIDVLTSQVSAKSLATFQVSASSVESATQLDNAIALGNSLAGNTNESDVQTQTAQTSFLSGLAKAQHISDIDELQRASLSLSGQQTSQALSALSALQHQNQQNVFDRLDSVLQADPGAYSFLSNDHYQYHPNGWGSSDLKTFQFGVGADNSFGDWIVGAQAAHANGSIELSSTSNYDWRLTSMQLYAQRAVASSIFSGTLGMGQGYLQGHRWIDLANESVFSKNKFHQKNISAQWALPIVSEKSSVTITPSASLSYMETHNKGLREQGTTGFEMGSKPFDNAATSATFKITAQKPIATLSHSSINIRGGLGYTKTWENGTNQYDAYYAVDPSFIVQRNFASLDDHGFNGFFELSSASTSSYWWVRLDSTQQKQIHGWGINAGWKFLWK